MPVRVTVNETEPACCATEYSSAENAMGSGWVVAAVEEGVAAGVAVVSLLVVLGAVTEARAGDSPAGLPDDVSVIPPHAARANVRAKVAATRSTVAVRVFRIIT